MPQRLKLFSIALFAGVISLILAEVLLRIIQPLNLVNVYRWDSVLGHTRIANTSGTYRTSEFSTLLSFNNFGFRGKDYQKQKSESKIRIGVFGDSYVEASQVEDDDSMTRIIERELNNYEIGCQCYEVLNFGVSGYGTTQEMLLIERTIDDFDLDVVVLMMLPANDIKNNSIILEQGINDFAKGIRPYLIKNSNGQFSISKPSESSKDSTEQSQLFYSLRRHSALITLLFKALTKSEWLSAQMVRLGVLSKGHLQALHGIPTDYQVYNQLLTTEWAEAWENTFESLKMIKATCSKSNIPLYVGIIPNREQIFTDIWFNILKQYPEMNSVESWSLDYPNKILKEFFIDNGISYIDLIDAFLELTKGEKASDYYFPIDGHFTAHGHKVAGKSIAGFVFNNLARN